LTAPPANGSAGGVVLGMLVSEADQPAVRALLLRHVLTTAIVSGRVVVSTPWRPYQQLSVRLGLRQLGETRHDFYQCGRPSGVFSQTFTAQNLPRWLRRLQRPVRAAPDSALTAAIRHGLEHLREPVRLRANPLLTLPGLSTPVEVVAFLQREIDTLIASESKVDAEAGQALDHYYVRRSGGHDLLAHRLHLSRATYFRRLDHGIRRIAAAARWLAAEA
jgi:hypothetical protein